jgi:hypothetical protein
MKLKSTRDRLGLTAGDRILVVQALRGERSPANREQLEEIAARLESHDASIADLSDHMRRLMVEDPDRPIGDGGMPGKESQRPVLGF